VPKSLNNNRTIIARIIKDFRLPQTLVASCAVRGNVLLGQTRPLEETRKAWQAVAARFFTRHLAPLGRRSATVSMHPSESKLAYRPDLDGLRALAVLSVVFFHFDFLGFFGGFVGVDIFFVISGYLITSIIVGELESGSFSFARFYERRIRRIVPAFIVMLAAASIAAIALFPPKELAQLGLSAAAAAAFCSNIFFAFQTNYFSGSDTMMPLLHTWSLGVEEQFYIVWPLLLFACYRLASRLAVSVLVVGLAVASLSYSEWGTASKYAAQLFYLLQSRAWELMFGAILALGLVPRFDNRWLRDGLALLGVGMIAFAVTQFSSVTRFPGLWATIPCLGAVLVILTGQQRDTAVYRLLSLPPFVFIGLISYSLYLWHWPVYAFAENYVGRPIALGETFALIILSIAIAAASWRYVEQPFRYGDGRAVGSQRAYFVGGLGALGLAACVGGAIYLGDGLPGRLGPDTLRFYLASYDHNPLRSDCLDGSGHTPFKASHCTAPAADSGYDVLVWGDSHGDALFPAIAAISQDHGLTTRQVTKRACPPILGAERVDEGRRSKRFGTSACEKYNAAMLEELQEGPRPSLVILIARWSMYTETTVDFAGNRRVFLIDNEHRKLNIETSREVLSRALFRTVDAITALGIRVLLIGQPPEFFQNPNVCFVERAMSRRDVGDCFKLPKQVADQRLEASKNILRKIAIGRSSTTYVSLDSVLCDNQVCWAKRNDRPLYEDNSHLDLSGASFVGRALAKTPNLQALFVPPGLGTHASIHHVIN
jgi:peptidoglycan/LPS O-acetylase OafA/YrhL